MAAAIAAHRMRVDRIHLVARGQQRPDQQAPVSLDPHHDLCRVLDMDGHQRMQLPHPRQTIRDPAGDQDAAVLIEQAQVMVALAPVHPEKQHNGLLCSDLLSLSQRRTCGALMAADNQTTIAGNLVETPELRFTNTGTPVTNLRVAVTQRVQDNGTWRDGETSFFKVNVWRGQAEHLADSLSKGDRSCGDGRPTAGSFPAPGPHPRHQP
jgi:hypothetical protein